MKKYAIAAAVALFAVVSYFKGISLADAFQLLKERKDLAALQASEEILFRQPDNLEALWVKAEVLRRRRSFEESEGILNKILEKKPDYPGALISLAYIRYKDDRLEEARQLVNRTLKNSAADKENLALSYMMLGAINSRRSAKGGFWAKLTYGTQVKSYFMKARALAPDLPEVHLGLGTFYLCAPAFAGGNLDEACRELEEAVKIAPEFATANARLAQAYKKKGDLEKYNLYLIRAKAQDPENEVVQDEEPGNK